MLSRQSVFKALKDSVKTDFIPLIIHEDHRYSKLVEKFSLGLCKVTILDIAFELPYIVVPLRS